MQRRVPKPGLLRLWGVPYYVFGGALFQLGLEYHHEASRPVVTVDAVLSNNPTTRMFLTANSQGPTLPRRKHFTQQNHSQHSIDFLMQFKWSSLPVACLDGPVSIVLKRFPAVDCEIGRQKTSMLHGKVMEMA